MKCDIILDTEDHISEIAINESASKIVPKNSVLCVVRSGILAHTFPVSITGVDVSFNQDMTAIVPGKTVLSKYLYFVLRNDENIIVCNGVKIGATVHSLHSGFLKQYKIPLPPISIQEQIIAEIEVEQKLIEPSKQLVQVFTNKLQNRIDGLFK